MNDLLTFADKNVFLAFLAIYFAYELVKLLVWRLPNRVLRTLSIRKHGWPPPHCDAMAISSPNPMRSDGASNA
jgi:hypothetical protein